MDLTVPASAISELAAAYLLAVVTAGLGAVCAALYVHYKKRYFAVWTAAWMLYALRLGVIIVFIHTSDLHWLYWHQVVTGWTALALLWSALVFSQQLEWRNRYLWFALFPLLWSYVAVYQLDNFMLAAGPTVVFLSGVTIGTGLVFFKYFQHIRSMSAAVLSVALVLWGLHHLNYPFLRARGIWNPWGYYLDILFILAVGAGILLLVLEDLHRGVRTLSALSRDLQRITSGETELVTRLLERPLSLAGVRGTAMYLGAPGMEQFVAGAGSCANWKNQKPEGAAAKAISGAIETREPNIQRTVSETNNKGRTFAYAAALPITEEANTRGAMVIVGDARDPFAALDREFLAALGQQVGAALGSADLYKRLADRKIELERLATRMLTQHEEERSRLSRELHDETAQVLSAVKLQLGVLRESAEDGSSERLDRILTLVDDGLAGIRNVTNKLRPALLDEVGLIPALRVLVTEFKTQSNVATKLDIPVKTLHLSRDSELALFRALQEGLSNVARHANASNVYVELTKDANNVVLNLVDDGKGVPSERWEVLESKGHMGLTGMRERITLVGGTVSLSNANTGGVRLEVRVPQETEKVT